MTRNPIPRAGLALALLLSPLRAEETTVLRDQLRDALYTEEVTRDREAAAKQYEALLAGFDGQRAFAASALFRLAEVRRKQDRKDEAAALYQRLLREFPEAQAEVRLARENLTALGVPADPAESKAADAEALELAKLREQIASSPDRLKDADLLMEAIRGGRLRSVEFLLQAGAAGVPRKLLEAAVETGNLRTITLLLDHPFKEGNLALDTALFQAVRKDYRDVAALLLSRGADPNADGYYRISENGEPPSETLANMTVLHMAVRKRDGAMCRFLLDHKADPNRMAGNLQPLDFQRVTMPGYPTGTPLHDAVVCSLEITRLLLERGGDVKAASKDSGFTALHSAVRPSHLMRDEDRPEILKLLVEKGAEIDARTAVVPPPDSNRPQRSRERTPTPSNLTPLGVALAWNDAGAARWLIAAGASTADPELLMLALGTENPGLVKLLLAADPKRSIAPEWLRDAIQRNNLEMIRLLVEAGADPNAPWPGEGETLLQVAARGQDPEGRVKLLTELGAKPGEAWMERIFEGAGYQVMPILVHRFLVPRLFERRAVSLIQPDVMQGGATELAADQADAPPLPLAQLLLNQRRSWIVVNRNEDAPVVLTVFRKGAEPIRTNLSADAELPALQWGDVVELSPDWEAIGGRTAFNIEYRDSVPRGIRWNLLRRISFPLTVEIDGRERELTMRGDRLVFDPGSNEVPWSGAAALARRLFRPENPESLSPPPILVRKGWPRIEVNRNQALDVPLQPGDRLVISSDGTGFEPGARKGWIVVTGAGIPYARRFDLRQGGADSAPSLLQALAQVVGGDAAAEIPEAGSPAEVLERMAPRSGGLPVDFLPHPDLSKLVIRRLQDDGTETRIPVDLTEVIAAAGAEVSPEAARAADVALVAGDIVEISQLSGMAGKPWKGPSPELAAFLAKALDCRIFVASENGVMEPRRISYAAPRFVEVAGQWIPTRPAEGTPSLTPAQALGWQEVKIARGDSTVRKPVPGRDVFLRDGDLVESMGAMTAPPRVVPLPTSTLIPPPPRQVPRPVVMPPAPSRR